MSTSAMFVGGWRAGACRDAARRRFHRVFLTRLALALATASGAVLAALAAGGTGCIAVPLTPGTAACDDGGQPGNATLQEMLDNLNAYRLANGLSALRYSTRLEAAANAHARDLFQRNFFSHTNPDGDGPLDRALDAGTCLTSIGENIAMIPSSTPDDVQLAWQGSAGHDENMRRTNWTHVGMGRYDAGNGAVYWVQVFGG